MESLSGNWDLETDVAVVGGIGGFPAIVVARELRVKKR